MLKEIQDIKNELLICLDFDDCIIEYSRKENGKWINNSINEITKKLKKNVNIIKEFCEKTGAKVFIISSWSPLINRDLTANHLDKSQEQWWNIIKTLPIIGKDPFKDRILAMEVLLDNGNRIICIDDWDLAPHFEWARDKFKMINVINGINIERLKNLKELK